MPYILLCFIIGQIFAHHQYTACFFIIIVACSMVIKVKSFFTLVLSLCACSLGYIIELQLVSTLENGTMYDSHSPTKDIIVEVKYLTPPIFLNDEITALVQTKNHEKLHLKSYQIPKASLPKLDFYATHSCYVKGKYKPSARSGQLAHLTVKQLQFNNCKPDHPSWTDRIRLIRNTYISQMRSSQIHGKDKLIALATGDVQFINSKQLTLIRQLGISHLFAVSGTHVAIFIGLLYQILKRLPIPICVIKIILALILPCYLVFAGEGPSAQRAVIMTILLFIFSKYISKKGITFLALSYIILSLNDPNIHYHLGFQFSFAICFLLLMMQNTYMHKPFIITLLLTSFISFYGSIPISYQHFNEIQWQSLITNIYFLPLYGLIIIPISMLTIFFAVLFPSILSYLTPIINPLFIFQDFLLWLSAPLAQYHWIIPEYGEIGYLTLSFVCFVSVYLIAIKAYRKYVYFSICCIGLSILTLTDGQDEMTMINVGQGDAILFKSRKGQTLLIDTGGQIDSLKYKSKFNITERKLFPTLKQKGIRSIDYVLITHAHSDHMGELKTLSQTVNIRNIIFNPHHFEPNKLNEIYTVAKHHNIKLRSAFKLKYLTLGDFKFQFINATISNSQNPNDHSVITLANIRQSNILLMGDATVENEKELLKKVSLPPINILKVGHHGSITSTSESFLNYVKPQYALISSGKNNLYRLPHPTILKRLHHYNVITFNTANTDTLSIRFDKKRPKQFKIYNQKN